jgi:hypothetical protein
MRSILTPILLLEFLTQKKDFKDQDESFTGGFAGRNLDQFEPAFQCLPQISSFPSALVKSVLRQTSHFFGAFQQHVRPTFCKGSVKSKRQRHETMLVENSIITCLRV